MRICVVSSTIFQLPLKNYGGLEAIAWECAKGLASKGHKVSLVAPEGSYCPGVEIISIGPEGRVNEKQAYGAYWQKLLEMDVIIDHSWAKHSYMLKAEGRLKAPVLGVMHAPVKTMYQILPPVEKPCIVCISKDQALQCEQVHEREARVAYNGIDLDFYRPIGVPRTNRYLFLARFSTIKSPDIAQDVCLDTNNSLDLIGDCQITQEPEYLERIKSKADGNQIRFVGPASRSECVYWFSQAHGLIHLCPNFREPFGLAPIEAQACGAPVLCWDKGAMRETVLHHETGFIVKSVDEAKYVLKNNLIGSLNRNKCREWASHFSVQNMCDRYSALCDEAVSTGGW